MLRVLSRYWWLIGLRGALAIIFGILALLWPVLTLGVLVILFGVYVLVDGISAVITGFSDRNINDRWWVLLVEGLVGILAGIMVFIWPNLTAVLLLFFIAIWALFTGVLRILAAIRLRQEIENEWVLGLIGVLSVLFGVALFINPGAGAVALIWIIGSYAILFGILLLYLAFKVRDVESRLPRFDTHPNVEST